MVQKVLIAILAVVSAVVATIGVATDAPLSGMALTLVLLLAVGLALWRPFLATAVFILSYLIIAIFPEYTAIVDVMLGPIFVGVVAYRVKLKASLIVAAIVFIVGLVDPSPHIPTLVEVGAGAMWLLFFVATTLAGWTIRRWERTRSDMEKEFRRQRDELALTLHDSVAASLTSVVIKAEVLQLKRGNNDGELCEELETIAQASRLSMRQIRQLIAVLDRGQINDLRETAESLRGIFDQAIERLERQGFAVERDTEHTVLKLDPAVLDLINTFIGEAVTNAIKYARPNSDVIMEQRYENAEIVVSLKSQTDNNALSRGNGADSDLSSGFGIQSLAEAARKAGGQVVTDDSEGYWLIKLQVPA